MGPAGALAPGARTPRLHNRGVATTTLPTLTPMLAREASRPPVGDGWAFELKWDGIRALTVVEAGSARVLSRRGEDITIRYPELEGIGAGLQGRGVVLDGEVVAFDDEGRPSFQRLQQRMGLTNTARIRQRLALAPVTYVAFDLLYLDGASLCDEPYARRRELLDGLALDGPNWQVPRHHLGDGAELLELVRERRLEGIVAKRLDSPYRPGRRSSDWIKVKVRRTQDVLIGGYMPGEGGRAGRVGSLLVGYWDATPEEADRLERTPKLVYAGGVGTGFTQATLEMLGSRLAPLRRASSPFEAGWDPREKYKARARERGGLVWCEPELVCEVEFTEWTHEGTLRAAAFKGLRDDRDPREVVREP
jgi:bifunctional non-homologous end joining protein LigD